MIEPNKVHLQIDAWSLHAMITPLSKSSWQHKGYYLIAKQEINKNTSYRCDFFYPGESENNTNRALQLLQSRALMHISLEHTKCKARIEDNLNI